MGATEARTAIVFHHRRLQVEATIHVHWSAIQAMRDAGDTMQMVNLQIV